MVMRILDTVNNVALFFRQSRQMRQHCFRELLQLVLFSFKRMEWFLMAKLSSSEWSRKWTFMGFGLQSAMEAKWHIVLIIMQQFYFILSDLAELISQHNLMVDFITSFRWICRFVTEKQFSANAVHIEFIQTVVSLRNCRICGPFRRVIDRPLSRNYLTLWHL